VRTIVLLGLRGAGKSTVARELARRTGAEVVDLDREVVARAGKPIPRIFADEGEEKFRALETEALKSVLGKECVLAPGGGCVLRAENRDSIRRSGALVVYLKAKPETLAARVAGDEENERPPLVPGGPLAEAKALLVAREPFYLELARVTVETDELTAAQVSERIVALGKTT
jgi:shikimate kinase